MRIYSIEQDVAKHFATALVLVGVLGALIALVPLIPVGVDWGYNYAPISLINPYMPGGGFIQPPWILLFLPHRALPLPYSNAINLLLNFAVIVAAIRFHGGDWKSFAMIALFPPTWDLARTNNIDWLPLAATMLPPSFALPIFLAKPQTLGGICLIWVKRHGISWLWLGALILAASFILWPGWPLEMKSPYFKAWNFAPFPLLIPMGIYLLWRAWHDDDEWLAALSTSLIMPYVGAYSFTAPFAILAARYPKIAATVCCGVWWYIGVELR